MSQLPPVYCSSCGKPNTPNAKFCNECAKPIAQASPVDVVWQPITQIACPDCKMLNPSTNEFCYACHKPLFYAHQISEPPPKPLVISTEQQIKNWWNKQTQSGKVITVAIGLFIVIAFVTIANKTPNNQRPTTPKPVVTESPPAPPVRTELSASVRFTGTQFVITNNESFDLTNIKMEINGGIFSGGYELKHGRMKAKETYTVGALQFADNDGKRFNPFQMKPQKFTISADSSIGHLFYVGGWN
jgi:hypothetical protein